MELTRRQTIQSLGILSVPWESNQIPDEVLKSDVRELTATVELDDGFEDRLLEIQATWLGEVDTDENREQIREELNDAVSDHISVTLG